MIPWNVLRDIVNQAISETFDGKAGLWHLILDVARSKNTRLTQPFETHFRKGLNALKSRAMISSDHLAHAYDAPNNQGDALSDAVRDFCWMPGNIFLGPPPENRTDDPGDNGFDDPPNRQESERVEKLHSFYSKWTTEGRDALEAQLKVLVKLKLWDPRLLIAYDIAHWGGTPGQRRALNRKRR
jgi:hypothetical protein